MTPNKSAINSLLSPDSVAIVGASPTENSAGWAMARALLNSKFGGKIYLVNPRHTEILGHPSFSSVSSLPEVPDHVVIGLANTHLEAALDEAIALGVRAVSIFASGYLETDSQEQSLLSRLKSKAEAAGVAICGPNSMGFLHPEIGLRVGAFDTPVSPVAGGVVWLAQSGSALSALTYNQPRIGFKLAVSTGSEIATDLSDYMLWALDQPTTRVIGIFLEGVRKADQFVAALKLAKSKRIPVVVLKVGRTQRSAAMAASHTGALAGNDGAYQALFKEHNVIQVSDLDEMAATLAILDTDKTLVPGGLATMHDSGGERELLVDLAEATGTYLAEISDETRARIQPNLDVGLEADNPLDAWGTARDFEARFTRCAEALLDDLETGILGFFSDPRDGHSYHRGVLSAMVAASVNHEKSVFIASNTHLTDDEELVAEARENGVAIVKGTSAALAAVRKISRYAAHQDKTKPTPVTLPAGLNMSGRLDEAEGLALLKHANIPVPWSVRAQTLGDLQRATNEMPDRVVLKTDEGHAHKSDIGGVVLNLTSAEMLLKAYEDMARRLGPKVLVMEQVQQGVEIGLGAIMDDNFGPVIAVSAGGVLIEVFKDVQFALAPFDASTARRMLESLAIAPLLESQRGRPACHIDALSKAISDFSALVWALNGQFSEIDVNPIVSTPEGVVAVDALFVSPKES